jgi:hypothetical protein
MIQPTTTDIIELLKQIINMLQPFAQSNGIMLRFASNETKLLFSFRPDLVIQDMTTLICQIISYTPQGNRVTLTAGMGGKGFKITINNTGINLSPVAEIVRECKQQVLVKGNKEKKNTFFELTLPITAYEGGFEKNNTHREPATKKQIPDYYDVIRKRLRSHFAKADNLVAQLSILYPKEAAFLQKINAVIIANIENELFDTSVLSKEMNMSRASLFRTIETFDTTATGKVYKNHSPSKSKGLAGKNRYFSG